MEDLSVLEMPVQKLVLLLVALVPSLNPHASNLMLGIMVVLLMRCCDFGAKTYS